MNPSRFFLPDSGTYQFGRENQHAISFFKVSYTGICLAEWSFFALAFFIFLVKSVALETPARGRSF